MNPSHLDFFIFSNCRNKTVINSINPKDIADAFIINPYMRLFASGDFSDGGGQVLIFLEVCGYSKWKEIADLQEVKQLNTDKMCSCKKSMLKELGIVR